MRQTSNDSPRYVPDTNVVAGYGLEIVSPTPADQTEAMVRAKVQRWLTDCNRVSTGTAGDMPTNVSDAEVYFVLDRLKQRAWFVRSPNWVLSWESKTRNLLYFVNKKRRNERKAGMKRNGPATIRNEAVARTIAKRYCSILGIPWPTKNPEVEVTPDDHLRTYRDVKGAGDVRVDFPFPTPGGYPVYSDMLVEPPNAQLIMDNHDATLLHYRSARIVRFVTTQARVSASKSLAIANHHVPTGKHQGKPELYYVVPMKYQLPGGTLITNFRHVYLQNPVPLHLCWVIYHSGRYDPKSLSGAHFTFIDAQTGELVGRIGF